MATYHGKRTLNGCMVTVDGEELPLRLDLRNHSPTGFEWGYEGSGPAQLALAILAHHCGQRTALHYYQSFKAAVVAGLKNEEWTLTSEQVETVLKRLMIEESRAARMNDSQSASVSG